VLWSASDGVVNPNLGGATVGEIVPSHLEGRAQLQLSPPVLDVPDNSGTNIRIEMQVRSRFIPDPQTSALAEFIRGELHVTVPVNQVASQVAKVIEVDIKANNLNVNFIPAWSSRDLSAEDLAGINLLIRNALKTGFLPCNSPLPNRINFMQFKTLSATEKAIAVMLNMGDVRGDANSLQNSFLGTADDFAFAVDAGYIKSAFNFSIGQHFQYWVYTFSVNNATLDFQDGKIVLTVSGHAHTPKWYLPDFDVTVHQSFTLDLVSTTPGGPLNTAQLKAGDISGGITGWLLNMFAGNVLEKISQQSGQDPQAVVRQKFSTEENFGEFLRSLLRPAVQQPGVPPQETLSAVLAYTAYEIKKSGIVMHGSLTVPAWPVASAEYEEIPAQTGGANDVVATAGVPSGPAYSALNSWIPGGRVLRYEWSTQGHAQPFSIDENKFVLLPFGPQVVDAAISESVISAFTPMCLTVRGVRLSSSGPVVEQSVAATVCGYSTFPLVNESTILLSEAVPLLALTRRGPLGTVEVVGHTTARENRSRGESPNLLVHFGDEKTAGRLERLVRAVQQSGRSDAGVALLVILRPEQLANSRYVANVIYSEDEGGAWERAFAVKSTVRPLTLIVRPDGIVVWQHEGEFDDRKLTEALQEKLVRGGFADRSVLRPGLRIGRTPPNFLFEYASGYEMTLRKLVSRPVTIVFWRSMSRTSVEEVQHLQRVFTDKRNQGPVLIAVNDGETTELVKRTVAAAGISTAVVMDPLREISAAYGVNMWPTTVSLDASGVVRKIHYGRFVGTDQEEIAAGV
jgi:hypothetical protein